MPRAHLKTPSPSPDAGRVLVVVNDASLFGNQIAAHYCELRGVPSSQVVHLKTEPSEEVSLAEYSRNVEAPVRRALATAKEPIDFLLLIKGVPLRIREGGFAVDSYLGAMDLKVEPMFEISREGIKRLANPYFRSTRPFSHKDFHIYLVTRIDGYDLDACLDLIDHACEANPEKGLFYCDQRGWHDRGPDTQLNDGQAQAISDLKKRQFQAEVEPTRKFVTPAEPLMGYFSAASNDGDFTPEKYHALRFRPGGIAETNVSTSARTFLRTTGGQSLIADLIEQGATGCKGYVSEPYDFAIARPEILFDRYTKGFTLAESFYAASLLIKWKDVVIGDTICRPYGGR